MSEALASVLTGVRYVSVPEWFAVALALAYLGFAIRMSRLCWWFAVASAGLYTALMYDAGLYMESALQVFYMVLAIYGWYQWQTSAAGRPVRRVADWPLVFHLPGCAAIAVLAVLSGAVLERFTDAAFPYADSFTTWGALLATWMTARKVLQSWHYWFFIDAVSVYLYWQRELFLTAVLFMLYLVLIVVGYRAWRSALPPALRLAQ